MFVVVSVCVYCIYVCECVCVCAYTKLPELVVLVGSVEFNIIQWIHYYHHRLYPTAAEAVEPTGYNEVLASRKMTGLLSINIVNTVYDHRFQIVDE